MVYASIIMSLVVVVLPAVIKDKEFDLKLSKEENLKIIKRNKILRIVLLVIYCTGIAYFCWSIAMFALHLPQGTSYMWIFNTVVSMLVKLFITSLITLAIKVYIVERIIEYFKNKQEEEKQKQIELDSDEEN